MYKFRRFGGMNHMSRYVSVRSRTDASSRLIAVSRMGLPRTRQTMDADLDMNERTVTHVESIGFADGTVQTTAATAAEIPDDIVCTTLTATASVTTNAIDCSAIACDNSVECHSLECSSLACDALTTDALTVPGGSLAMGGAVVADIQTTDTGPTSSQAASVAAVHEIVARLVPDVVASETITMFRGEGFGVNGDTYGVFVSTPPTLTCRVINLFSTFGSVTVKSDSGCFIEISCTLAPFLDPATGAPYANTYFTAQLLLPGSPPTNQGDSVILSGPLKTVSGNFMWKLTTASKWIGPLAVLWTCYAW